MANIKLSSFITDISGTIGGTVFQKTRSGYIAKNNFYKNASKSPINTQRSSILAYLVHYWETLTEAQRISWAKYSVFAGLRMKKNSKFFLSGKEAFIQLNYLPIVYGYNIKASPTYSRYSASPLTVDLYQNHSVLSIETSRPLVSADEFLALYCTEKIKETITNPGGRYKLIVFSSGVGSIVSIKDEYEAQFGIQAPVNSYIFYKWKLISRETYLSDPWHVINIKILNIA